MIGRRKPTPVEPEPLEEVRSGKGRPTPKRREVEAQNRRPLVPDDRKEAKRRSRELRNEAYTKQRQAMITGDERYLPVRDKGPVRRYARDYVDARWSIAEFFMPVALVMIVVMLFAGSVPQLAQIVVLAMYAVLLVAIIDSTIMAQILKRRLTKKFGAGAIAPWTAFYAFGRSFYWRRLRQPKPQVKRGEYPS
ncbi:DUF3043 domain-containing protein [Georgenia yuyongxinii]|uniref:DUF3043 domain-containing protein n=1 Tax=Georgenia yuyongxinii TaxID=2589797 RepID=A0A552WKP9_9MICO|nr:DUF3043 domain-containing protein [Georgenia yuyongxinii]TRW43328.1 DUF3043 domain-containing protein [Georgenia yuyongxinii]